MRNLLKPALLISLLSIAGCVSKTTNPEQYSGFLSDYSDLKETTSNSGKPVLRWIDPQLKSRDYDRLIYTPIVYYPEPHASSQVGQQALSDILDYTNNKVKAAMSQHMALASVAGPRTLIFRGAITAVNTNKEGLQFYELLPITAVVASTQAMTGHRTMDTNLYFEGELIDATTKKTVLKVIRKNQGKQLSNESKKLTISELKAAIDGMANDFSMFKTNQP